jgi:hypothetical protein
VIQAISPFSRRSVSARSNLSIRIRP